MNDESQLSTEAAAAVVSCISIVTVALCWWLTLFFKDRLLKTRIVIPIVCFGWSIVAITFTAALAATETNKPSGILTTKTWFSAGWNTGLSVFSIRINNWWRYLCVVIYQIVRSFLGSLIINIFRSYLIVKIQASSSGKKSDSPAQEFDDVPLWKLIGAQLAFNFFIFHASIMDSWLMLSQIDMTLITVSVTMLADSICTWLFVHERWDKLARDRGGHAPSMEKGRADVDSQDGPLAAGGMPVASSRFFGTRLRMV